MVDTPDEVPSPCVRNCCLDQQDICLGCLRTLQEIKDWHTATAQEKQLILARCAQRRMQRNMQQCPPRD